MRTGIFLPLNNCVVFLYANAIVDGRIGGHTEFVCVGVGRGLFIVSRADQQTSSITALSQSTKLSVDLNAHLPIGSVHHLLRVARCFQASMGFYALLTCFPVLDFHFVKSSHWDFRGTRSWWHHRKHNIWGGELSGQSSWLWRLGLFPWRFKPPRFTPAVY